MASWEDPGLGIQRLIEQIHGTDSVREQLSWVLPSLSPFSLLVSQYTCPQVVSALPESPGLLALWTQLIDSQFLRLLIQIIKRQNLVGSAH